MARSKTSFRVHLEYWPLRLFLEAIGRLPKFLAVPLLSGILYTALAVLPKKRRLMRESIRRCFPHFSRTDQKKTYHGCVHQLAQGFYLTLQIPRMTQAELHQTARITGLEHLEKALDGGRGAICFTGHIGCWEVMALRIASVYPTAVVARALDNPRLEAWLKSVREHFNESVIERRKLIREGFRQLRRNGILGILIDQNFAGEGGVFVDFFGRPASTTPIVSVLARRTGCAVLPVHNTWNSDDTITIHIGPPVAFDLQRNDDETLREETQHLTHAVESWIRETPSEWLWMHNRWKKQPEEKRFLNRNKIEGTLS